MCCVYSVVEQQPSVC